MKELSTYTDAELEQALRQLHLSENHPEWFSKRGYGQVMRTYSVPERLKAYREARHETA